MAVLKYRATKDTEWKKDSAHGPPQTGKLKKGEVVEFDHQPDPQATWSTAKLGDGRHVEVHPADFEPIA
jgi:hypothetical protein